MGYGMKIPVKNTDGPAIQDLGRVGGGLSNRVEADVTIHGLPSVLGLQKTVPSTSTAMMDLQVMTRSAIQ